MIPTQINLAGESLLLLREGAAFVPITKTLVVADLHLEKSTARRESGVLLPPYDTALTLDRLAALVTQWRPDIVISLGDGLHDTNASRRLSFESRNCLHSLSRQVQLLWITGNHDPRPVTDLPGQWHSEYYQGALVFRHIPSNHLPPDIGEIAGHFHPKIRIKLKGHTLSRSCFVCSESRLILPAFGSYTGGLDVQNPTFAVFFPRDKQYYLLGRDRLYKSVGTWT